MAKYQSKWLFKKNNQKVFFKTLIIKDEVLNYKAFDKIIKFIDTVKYKHIYFQFDEIYLDDKLSISILENIVYNLIVKEKRIVVIGGKIHSNDINIESINVSPLRYLGLLLYETGSYSEKKFLNSYKFDIHSIIKDHIYHYRRLLSLDEVDDTTYSKIDSDIYYSLPDFISEDKKESISKLIDELVENSIVHGKSDCIFDIDITSKHYSKIEDNNDYFGINITVMNISDVLFFEKIKNKVMNMKFDNHVEKRYKYVYDAYLNQQKNFDEDYNENNFWSLANLQDRISGREYQRSGGKGLTTLVNALQTSSDTDNYDCYILSGDIVLRLEKEYLKYSSEKWLGFNKENNFNQLPDKKIFSKSLMSMHGTAYNISFYMKG